MRSRTSTLSLRGPQSQVTARLGRASSIPEPLPAMWGARWMGFFLVVLALIPTFLFGDSNRVLVVLLSTVPIAAFALGEFLVERRRGPLSRPPGTSPRFIQILLGVALLCAMAGHLIAILGGFGSVAEVVTGYQYSSLYSLARMMMSITPFAVALTVFAEYFGTISRRLAWLMAMALVGVAFMNSILAGYLGGALGGMVVFLVLGSMTRLVRWRVLLAALMVSFVLLSPLFDLRDDVRESVGLGRSSEVVGPFARLRVDKLISLLDGAWPSSWVPIPDLALLLRTAFVPRILDPSRPSLDVGQQINYALGSTSQSNATFGHYGTVYWLFGIVGVVLVASLLGALFGLGVRHFDRVWGVAVLAAVVSPAVWPEVAFPGYLVGFVQFWQACLALVVVAYVLDWATTPQKSRWKSPGGTVKPRLDRNCREAPNAAGTNTWLGRRTK